MLLGYIVIVFRVRGCLHVRFCVQIVLRLCVPFPEQGALQFNFQPTFPEMCREADVIGVRRIIEILSPLFCKWCIESYGDSYAESDTFKYLLRLLFQKKNSFTYGLVTSALPPGRPRLLLLLLSVLVQY
jgi:hypothetical protein